MKQISIKGIAKVKANISSVFFIRKDLLKESANVASVKKRLLDLEPFGKLTTFNPEVHGFDFDNDNYKNETWFEHFKIETKGRCGGMVYAALDYYYNNIPIPSKLLSIPSGSKVPPDGTTLGNYIYERLMASFHNIWQPLSQRILPSLNNWYGKGIRGGDNFEELKNEVNNNRPKPIVLISMKSAFPGIVDAGSCHQVCGIGYYEGSQNEHDIRIYLYDPNYPGKWVYLKPNFKECCFEEWIIEYEGKESKRREWRNYFVDLNYKIKVPPNVGRGSKTKIDWSNTIHTGENLNGRNLQSYILLRANFQGAKMKACNLTGVDARWANFRQANITHSTLTKMRLEGASFEEADLRSTTLNELELSKNVNFKGANLGSTKLLNSQCPEGDFRNSALQEADLSGSNLDNSRFGNSIGNNTNFEKASLMYAQFDNSNFVSSKFRKTIMRNIDFSNALLQSSDFSLASAQGANFSKANLHSAKFIQANLKQADFSYALLHNADFTGANLNGCKWKGAITVNTKLPKRILELIAKGGY